MLGWLFHSQRLCRHNTRSDLFSEAKCKDCGTSFVQRRNTQRFCSASSRFHFARKKETREARARFSSEAEKLSEELVRLGEENEKWNQSVRKYHNIKDALEEQIDKLSETIKKKDAEIERLKFNVGMTCKSIDEIKRLTMILVRNNIKKAI